MEKQIIKKITDELRKMRLPIPEIAIVLGSGLGDFASLLTDPVIVPYGKLNGLVSSTAPGHVGQMVFGMRQSTRIMALQGRVHLYEGYTPTEVVRPIRVAAMLGVKKLILTNAAGGINPSFKAGDFMLITDQISTVPSPLIGENFPLGTRFPDMSETYNKSWANALTHLAPVPLKQGVYLQVSGPQYETPAEVRAYRSWGADAVGMSTAIEATAAAHAGLKTLGISCITNMATGVGGAPLSHDEIKKTAERNRTNFAALIDTAIAASTACK